MSVMTGQFKGLFCAALIALGVAFGTSSQAFAEKADKALPMNAQADAMRHDELAQTTRLTGNVVVTKGSIVMRGATIEVKVSPDGSQAANILGEAAKPAFFRQKREGINEFIEGEAEQITYDSKVDNVKLKGRSVLRRFAGAVLMDEIKGSLIVYDNVTERYTVDGGAANATTINPSGRVSAVISAKPKAGVVPAATVAPVAAASAVGVTLRPSTRIGDKTN
jgi:lipopolysaccharide export system protein LptA